MKGRKNLSPRTAPLRNRLASAFVLLLLLLQQMPVGYAAAAGTTPSAVDAALVDIPTSADYSQNFDGIGTTPAASLPADFRLDRLTGARVLGTYAAATTVTTQVGGGNLSSSAANGAYNFGSGTNTTGADRAIGFLSSGSATQSGNLYLRLTNNSGSGLDGLTISYDVEKYRSGSNAAGFRFQMYYSTNGTDWTNAGSDFFTGFAADANNNGFTPAPGETVSVSLRTLAAAIPSGSDFYLAWNYSVTSGSTTSNAQALAIDNLVVRGIPSGGGPTPTPTPTPGGTPTPTPDPSPTPTPTPSPTPTATPTPTPGPSADHLTISQLYGGGGNSGATYQNDYVEIYNPTSSPVDTAGWTIQYASATGTSWTNSQPLGGIIGPGEYFLVSLASGGAVGQTLPQPNIEGSINMSGTTGKLALVSNGDPLTGGCPIGNPNIVDFVGYGTTAGCFEGGTRAPAPSNTTAIYRVNGGAQDTNVNGTDFVVGAPLPRRTTPIQEIGPAVITTQPSRDGSNAPRDASPTISFSEPVTVDPNWFNISCPSGQHNDVTVASANSGKTWEITPNQTFTPGEQCTVTIVKDAVHDVDTDDSGPNTDTLPANYTWSFTVATMGQPAPYSPDIHLVMGNPSNATPNTLQPNNYLMQKPGLAMSYNRDKGTPNWVSWHLSSQWYGSLARNDSFRPDPQVPADWYRVTDFDYGFSGFDRGHMTPNADRDHQSMIPLNQETFLMSNMVPQAPDNNQGPWADMENDLRGQTDTGSELFIVSGPQGVGGVGSNGPADTIANGHVTVPAYTWKVVLVLPHGVVDPNQVTAGSARTFAVLMPNVNGIRENDWRIYKVTVRQVEALTGYNFFSNLPAPLQDSIETAICESAACNAPGDVPNPLSTSNQTVTTSEDTAVQFALNVSNPGGGSLTATTSTPAHGSVTCTGINCTYTPASNYNGPDSFTFSVSNGSTTSNTSTVTVNITAVNDAPAITTTPSTTATEDVAYTYDADSSDVDGPQAIWSVNTPTNTCAGAAINASTGLYTFTPAGPVPPASCVLSIRVRDGGSPEQSAVQTVTIQITAVNDAPTAGGDSYSTNEDTALSVTAPGVLANDSDPEGTAVTAVLVSGPAHAASFTLNANGSFTYTPSANYNGPDSFTYKANDGSLDSNPATVAITVNAVNDAPTITAATGITRTQAAGASVSQIATVGDVDNAANTLTVTVNGSSSATVNGVTVSGITVNAAGQVNASVAAACGATNASFTLRVSDPANASSTATLSITVVRETVPPVINPIQNIVAILPPNTSATSMPVSFALPTATDNCSAVTVTTSPASGSVFQVGTTTVNVTATDANGNMSTATFTVTVQFNFTGFAGRVQNAPATNYAYAGNTIPVSFSLSGDKGLNIFAPGSPSSQQVNCMTGTPIGASTPTSGSPGLIFSGGQYTYYWGTSPSWSGTCRVLSVTLRDGTTRTLKFSFYN